MRANQTVDLDTSFFQGSAEHIHQLPSVSTWERLDSLVRGRQIGASGDGQTVVVIRFDGTHDVVTHSRVRLPEMLFEPPGDEPGARIIEVTDSGVLLWGKPADDRPRGVYLLTQDRVELKDRLDELVDVRRTGKTVVALGRCSTDGPDRLRVVTPYGTITVPIGSVIVPLASSAIQVIEDVSGIYYRYEVGPTGFEEVYPVTVPADERLIGLLQMHDLKIVCLSGEQSSRFVAIGPMRHLFGTDGSVELEGCLERVWQSPNGSSVAWIVRRTENSLVKRSIFLNGRLLHDGSFSVHPKDVRWSPDEQMIGVRTSPLQSGQMSSIVTPTERLVLDSGAVEDYLVDNEGHVAARLMFANGEYTPYVYNLQHDTVPFAWNLTWSNGEVRYNSVNRRSVLATNDRTHLRELC